MKKSSGWATAFLATSLLGCTGLPEQRVEELPPLQVYEHRVEASEILAHCRKAMDWWRWVLMTTPTACATVNFEKQSCDIYATADAPSDVLEYERRHCRGYDHGGQLRTAFNKWRAYNGKQAPLAEQAQSPGSDRTSP